MLAADFFRSTAHDAMRKRHLWILLAVLLIAVAVTALFLLRRQSPPLAVRLLPESDIVLFVDVDTLRQAGAFKQAPQSHDPDYEDFVKQTGFDFERDLSQAAIAFHPAGVASPDGRLPAPADRRSSEVFIGHFDSARVTAYLKHLSVSTEDYGNTEVYAIPYEGRPVRVAILGVDTVAVSNLDSPQAIHTMIDQAHASAVPTSGPKIVREHLKELPFGTVAWLMARIGSDTPQMPGGLVPAVVETQLRGSTVIATVGYTGSLSKLLKIVLRVQAITPSEEVAGKLREDLETFLTFFRGLQQSMPTGGTDQDVKDFFDSLQVEQKGPRVTLSAELTPGFIQKITTEPPAAVTPPPATTPTPRPRRRR
jgi:hypothetical protein